MTIRIRAASPEDAAALAEIYRYYVEKTAISYEYEAPSDEEFRERIVNTLKKYPYLVAEDPGGIIGYAYAGPFKTRAAYAWDAETSIYLKRGAQGQGAGRMLYALLEDILKEQGVVKLVAVITGAVDELSDMGSPQFHDRMGYKTIGRIENCGHKFGRWYPTVWMEKQICPAKESMEPIKSFSDVRDKFGL